MANKKRQKRRFVISGELHWLHVVIFLVLCLVFVRETRFAMGDSGMVDNYISDSGNILSVQAENSDNIENSEGNGETTNTVMQNNEEQNFSFDGHNSNMRGITDNNILDQMPNFQWEDITVCHPYNNAKCFMIMDRNLGATATGLGGYYYQYGNNYGFPADGLVTTSSTLVDASEYGPGNYYYSGIFITNSIAPHTWDSSYNLNLRGGSGDTWNTRGSGTDEDRQGPCPEGYHIPSRREWESAYAIWNTPNATVTYLGNTKIAKSSNLGVSKDFSNDLMLPFAGDRSNSDSNVENRSTAYYHSSTAYWSYGNYISVYVLESRPNGIYHYYTNQYSDIFGFSTGLPFTRAISLRCFKNSQVFALSFESNGGSEPDNPSTTAFRREDVVLSGSTKEGYKFMGRYTTPTFDDGTQVTTNSIFATGPVTLYANWKKLWTISFNTNGGSFIDNQIVEDFGTGYEPIEPVKEGQVFIGWYLDERFVQQFDFENTIITGDIVLYAKWETCPEGFESISNKCVAISTGGYLKITNGSGKTFYIKDRNQGADHSLLDFENFKALQIIDKLELEILNLPCQSTNIGCTTGDYLNVINSVTNQNFEDIGEAEQYFDELYDIAYNSESNNSIYNSTYGIFYFWGNSNGATYDELHGDGFEGVIDELLYLRGFDNGKIGEDNTGWGKGEDDNPCDSSKGEYLPTMSDRKGVIDVWLEIHGIENEYEEGQPIPSKFFNDILVLGGYFSPYNGGCGSNPHVFCYQKNSKSQNLLVLLLSNSVYAYEDKYMGFYRKPYLWGADSSLGNGELQSFNQLNSDSLNEIVAPVRCFLKAHTVSFDTDGGSEIDDIEIVGNQPIQAPNSPTKSNYTFKGWYLDTGFTQEYDFSESVTSEMVLYAKWEKNKNTSSNGGGAQLKKDYCPGGDHSNSYYDGDCGAEPEEDNNQHHSAEVVYDTLRFNPHYSDEMNKAYQFAYHYGITTKTNIKDAAMNWELTRIAMAKMLSQYSINVLGIQPDKGRNNKFADVSDKLDTEYDDGVTLAYQLGIMGINMPNNEFKPYNYVTRAEFATALSRLLYHTSDGMFEKTSRYYVPHINKLAYEGILTNMDPYMKELRGYVMLMLMRSAK